MAVRNEVDKNDLKDLRETIIEEMRAGFSGVYARQDQTNGRVRAGEIQSAEYNIRIKNLERECFPHGGRRKVDPVTRPGGKITDRDVWIVFGTLGAAGSTIGFFWKLLPLMLKALTP